MVDFTPDYLACCVSFRVSIYLSVCLSVSLPIYLSIYPSIHLPIYRSIYLSIYTIPAIAYRHIAGPCKKCHMNCCKLESCQQKIPAKRCIKGGIVRGVLRSRKKNLNLTLAQTCPAPFIYESSVEQSWPKSSEIPQESFSFGSKCVILFLSPRSQHRAA